MSGYYYLDDSESELGYTPVSENEMNSTILSIVKNHGLNITDKMILDQIQKKESEYKNTKKKTHLYIDGTNLFAGQHEIFGPVLNFLNKFNVDRKLPRQLKVLSISEASLLTVSKRKKAPYGKHTG